MFSNTLIIEPLVDPKHHPWMNGLVKALGLTGTFTNKNEQTRIEVAGSSEGETLELLQILAGNLTKGLPDYTSVTVAKQ